MKDRHVDRCRGVDRIVANFASKLALGWSWPRGRFGQTVEGRRSGWNAQKGSAGRVIRRPVPAAVGLGRRAALPRVARHRQPRQQPRHERFRTRSEKSLGRCRGIGSLDQEVVQHSQRAELACRQAMQAVVTQRQLSVSSLHTRTAALEEIRQLTGLGQQVGPLGVAQRAPHAVGRAGTGQDFLRPRTEPLAFGRGVRLSPPLAPGTRRGATRRAATSPPPPTTATTPTATTPSPRRTRSWLAARPARGGPWPVSPAHARRGRRHGRSRPAGRSGRSAAGRPPTP